MRRALSVVTVALVLSGCGGSPHPDTPAGHLAGAIEEATGLNSGPTGNVDPEPLTYEQIDELGHAMCDVFGALDDDASPLAGPMLRAMVERQIGGQPGHTKPQSVSILLTAVADNYCSEKKGLMLRVAGVES